jgi:SAM-dependent methyltransferase
MSAVEASASGPDGAVAAPRPMRCPDPQHATCAPLAVFASGEVDFRMCPLCRLLFRARFPSPQELEAIYGTAYAANSIEAGVTNQESGDYATDVYSGYIRRRLLQPGARVLDFGAASGELVSRLRGAGVQVDGFEFAEAARGYAYARRGISLLDRVTDIPPAAYDLVTLIEVIEHLTDLWGTLGQLRAALKPGGSLFITTPNRLSWRARLEGGRWREARKKFHLFLFERRSLEHHLRCNGFAVQEYIRFAPVLQAGLPSWVVARGTQAVGLGGTLCCIATRR